MFCPWDAMLINSGPYILPRYGDVQTLLASKHSGRLLYFKEGINVNVSVIGLVYIPRGSLYLVLELLGLILAINVVYVAVFIALERKSLVGEGGVEDSASRGALNPTVE